IARHLKFRSSPIISCCMCRGQVWLERGRKPHEQEYPVLVDSGEVGAMSSLRPPRPSTPFWTALVKYYRSCLDREVELGIQVPAAPNARVMLQGLQEHLIPHKATTTSVSDPAHTQPILAYLNRRGRGIGGTFFYGY